MEPETIFFFGNELRGVNTGYRKVIPLKVGRKWVTVQVNGTRYRVRKDVWGKWPRKREENAK